MAEERHGTWFGFGFCGFGQALGSGNWRHSVHSPEPLNTSDDVCRVSASWSYTALVTRRGRVELSGSVSSAAEGCRDAWASEELLVLLRDKGGFNTELQAWPPGSELQGEPLWVQNLVSGAETQGKDEPSREARARTLPLLPSARAYVNPQPPFCKPLAPELRVRQLELGAEHALLLCEAGQVFSWGGGRHGQLGHGALEAELEPRLLEALQGLRMAEVAAGGWHSLCVSESGDIYIWGWNESGQLALPRRNTEEERKTVRDTELSEDCLEGAAAALGDIGAPAHFIAIQPFPALLDLPLNSDAVKASCGSRHTAVVTRTGDLYTWGWGKYGQLGHKDSTSLDRPCRVEYFAEKQLEVRAVTCGPWNTYVYAVQREKV
ncbi:RCC1 domain-containing protein 1 [Psammomys obesus]|uniref:RCC1 domain-containing protein 1 n=1 Tax=Psammomys obesus TaxID=48139 RepID=UPI0024536790|nr:RCC1 domain-containing protein 1 [Psammomys obesus]XP_055479310.1 RCC1 domain-containing protein 1 [Psammomys obesus]XP_055479311.1 RCC1 domain-containing protein 1 [Psammomys obesus]XP_055479312.1 RCC1 domain-containing protein 1 [Psammomys obesus]